MWDNTEHPAGLDDDYSVPMTRLDRVLLGALLALYVAGCGMLVWRFFA